MKARINSLDEVRPYQFDGIAKETKLETNRMEFARTRILDAVDEYLGIGGCWQPINEIMELLNSYLYTCSCIEGIPDNGEYGELKDDLKQCLPTFAAVNDTVFALKELFGFLLRIGDSEDSARRCESVLQAMRGMTEGAPSSDASTIAADMKKENLEKYKTLAEAYAMLAKQS